MHLTFHYDILLTSVSARSTGLRASRPANNNNNSGKNASRTHHISTLQGFLEKESWLMEKECRRHEMDGKDVRRKMKK